MNVSALKPHGSVVVGRGVQLARVAHVVDRTPVSRNPAHLVLIGADRVQWAGHTSRRHVVALPAATAHRTASCGRTRLVAYLDARRYRFEDVLALSERWAHVDPDRASLHALFEDATRVPAPHFDRRLERVLEALRIGLTVQQAAAQEGMSTNWLSRLMQEATGSPPRAWRCLLRLQRAVEQIAAGHPATYAAHAAGFADAAHLTRTSRRILGVAPRTLAHTDMAIHLDVW